MFARYQALPASVRALLTLFWIYSFTGGLTGAFTQIFLYQRFSSIELNAVASIVAYTGIMLGFCVPGFIASMWRLNVKWGFVWSFLITSGAILYLLHSSSMSEAYVAMLLWGAGTGAFWLTVNTFELTETKDGERDFYASILSAGNQVVGVLGPAVATLLIYLSSFVFHLGTFTLLFTVAPFVYLLGFLCFPYIRDYRPEPMTWSDVRHFFVDRTNQYAQLYTVGVGFQQFFGTMIPSLVILFILGTALKVGIYDTLFAIFSALCVLLVARYRTAHNRLLIYGLTSFGIAAITIWFGYAFTLSALVVYTLVEGILSPLNSVSSHVLSLSSMEVGRAGSDFYATMLLRDFFLWVWRCLAGFVFLLVLHHLTTEQDFLSAGMYLLAAGFVLTYISGFFFVRTMEHTPRVY